MKPSLRGAPQYLRFLTTIGPLPLAEEAGLISLTSALFPPSSVAWAEFTSATHVSTVPSAVVSEFHLTGKRCPTIIAIASRCSLDRDLSNVRTAQSICPLEKSPPRSPASQNF